jgi:glutamyl-tRNA synthetase
MPDGRFAPTPSGDLHLGNLRTALLAWLAAKRDGGRFVVRVDDLDLGTVRAGAEARQLDDLRSLGLVWDGEIVHQSERTGRYEAAIVQLVEQGLTYPCFCTRREILEAASAPHGDAPRGAYPGTCRELTTDERRAHERNGRPPALRVRAEPRHDAFVDLVAGPYQGLVDDVVVRRNDGTPAYNLAVVIDDTAQGIAEVVRGDDLLSSTPRQIHLAHLLALPIPAYAHVPLVLGADGRRLAKRDGPITLADRSSHGDTVPRVLGALAASAGLVPWGTELEPADLAAVASTFSFDEVSRAPWTVDLRAADPWVPDGPAAPAG